MTLRRGELTGRAITVCERMPAETTRTFGRSQRGPIRERAAAADAGTYVPARFVCTRHLYFRNHRWRTLEGVHQAPTAGRPAVYARRPTGKVSPPKSRQVPRPRLPAQLERGMIASEQADAGADVYVRSEGYQPGTMRSRRGYDTRARSLRTSTAVFGNRSASRDV